MATQRAAGSKRQPQAEAPSRVRGIQINARLSDDEKADLDLVIKDWEQRSYPAEGFADWLRAVIREKKLSIAPAQEAAKKR